MNQKEHFGSPLLSAGNCDEYIMFLILSNPHKVRLIPILELGEWGSEKSNNLDHLTSTKLKTQDSKQGTLTLKPIFSKSELPVSPTLFLKFQPLHLPNPVRDVLLTAH